MKDETRKSKFEIRNWKLAVLALVSIFQFLSSAAAGGQSSSVKICKAPPTGLLWSDDFESDDTDLVPTWDVAAANATLNSNMAYVRSGSKSGQFYYYQAAGGGHLDRSIWVLKSFDTAHGLPNGVEHVFIRGYVYHKTPAGSTDGVQRKLIYIEDSYAAPNWNIVVTTDASSGRLPVRVHTNIPSTIGPHEYWLGDPPYNCILDYDYWYCIELEVLLNALGATDGRLTLWVDGTQIWQATGLDLRDSFADGVGSIRIGEQTDRTDLLVDEYRYWDDVVISTSYIGP